MARRPSPNFRFREREVCRLRCEGLTISGIGAVVDLPPPEVEGILAAHKLLGPWSKDWRGRMRGAA